MLEQTSNRFRIFFLLEFTKELIRAGSPQDVFELKEILDEEQQEIKTQIKKTLAGKPRTFEIPPIYSIQRQNIPIQRARIPGILRIPEPKLPPRFSYLRPVPTRTEIDLGKLNPLIQNPEINLIECHGPDELIIATGRGGRKQTDIMLSKEEIEEVIRRFSKIKKIPVEEGIFRVAAGKLIITAIVSDVIGSKFLIRKMSYPTPYFRR